MDVLGFIVITVAAAYLAAVVVLAICASLIGVKLRGRLLLIAVPVAVLWWFIYVMVTFMIHPI